MSSPGFLARAVRIWKLWCITSPVSSYLAVYVLGLGVVEECSIGFFGRFFGCSSAILGSTVNTCSATGRDASGRNTHISNGEVNSNPEVFFLRSHAEWRSVLRPNDSGLRLRCRTSTDVFTFQDGNAQCKLCRRPEIPQRVWSTFL